MPGMPRIPRCRQPTRRHLGSVAWTTLAAVSLWVLARPFGPPSAPNRRLWPSERSAQETTVGSTAIHAALTHPSHHQPATPRHDVINAASEPSPKASPPPTHAAALESDSSESSAERAKARAAAEWQPHTRPVTLELRLPRNVLEHPSLQSHAAMRRAYGFNLNLSNHIPLAHSWPDYRDEVC